MKCYSINFAHALTMLVAIALLSITSQSIAQERVVSVEPGIGTLNEAIDSDTTDTGDRVEPENTVYELQAGGYYGLVGTIENRFPLYIRAQDGARAQLVPSVGEGGESGRAFEPRGDIRLENLYITNRDEAGGFNTRILRVRPDSAVVILDNCHLDYDGQSAIRLDGDWISLTITNSVISNIGRTNDPNNGRGIDTRGNNVESIIFHNTTFYNITSRLIRDGGGFIKYAEFSRNTMYNIMQLGISFGEIQEVRVTDNLFINPGFLGASDSTFAERVIIGIDSLSPDREGEQVIEVNHNWFLTNTEVLDAYPDSVRKLALVDSTSPAASIILDDPTNGVVDGSLEFVESIALGASADVAAVPAVPADVIQEFWAAQTAGLPFDDVPPMDNGDGGALPAAETLPFNFRYADSEPPATAAADGLPLGDRNWFDLVGVAVEESSDLPESYRLVGNYPNPFNPSTTIRFELAGSADVTLEVFDIAGRQLTSLDAGTMAAGSAEVHLDALNAPSGTYVYRVLIETGVDTKILSGTMTLLK